LNIPAAELIDSPGPPGLKELRLAAGLRQRDVAELLKIGVPYYCDIENGRHPLPQALIPRLASAYHVPESNIRAGQRPDVSGH
jgi:transcriptional regulator with XRE-family HTH domain